jgi:hypothetical protein
MSGLKIHSRTGMTDWILLKLLPIFWNQENLLQ